MNEAAVTNQNASDMIDKLTTAGRRRVTMAARDFARTFLIPLCQHICKMAMENDQTQDQIEMKGQMIPVIPAQWSDDDLEMEVAAALTPDEAQRNAASLMMVHQSMMQDPMMGEIYGVMQRHALFDHIFDLMGVKNTAAFMLSPQSPEFQQMQEMKQMQQQEQAAEARVQSELQKGLIAAQTAAVELQGQAAMTKAQVDQSDKMFDNVLAEDRLEHDKLVDLEKLEIERKKASGI